MLEKSLGDLEKMGDTLYTSEGKFYCYHRGVSGDLDSIDANRILIKISQGGIMVELPAEVYRHIPQFKKVKRNHRKISGQAPGWSHNN